MQSPPRRMLALFGPQVAFLLLWFIPYFYERFPDAEVLQSRGKMWVISSVIVMAVLILNFWLRRSYLKLFVASMPSGAPAARLAAHHTILALSPMAMLVTALFLNFVYFYPRAFSDGQAFQNLSALTTDQAAKFVADNILRGALFDTLEVFGISISHVDHNPHDRAFATVLVVFRANISALMTFLLIDALRRRP